MRSQRCCRECRRAIWPWRLHCQRPRALPDNPLIPLGLPCVEVGVLARLTGPGTDPTLGPRQQFEAFGTVGRCGLTFQSMSRQGSGWERADESTLGIDAAAPSPVDIDGRPDEHV